MASNFVKLCTAALAGSIIGIAYERMPPTMEWPSMMRSASALANSITPRNQRDQMVAGDEISYTKVPQYTIDPHQSGENLKKSAKFGLPSQDNLRLFNDFILSYDRRLRAPAWVIEHLTPEKLAQQEGSRANSDFHEDRAIHEYFRAKLADFRKSGYDRGHMAAAANHKTSQDNMDQTFVLSNVSPQVAELNQDAWNRLEIYVRWAAKRSKNLYVVSGPLYLPMTGRDGNLYVTYRVLGSNHVSVPTHYFKVFLIETKDNKFVLEAFLMPNNQLEKGVPIDKFRVPIEKLDTIERASGVIFFDQLSREKVEKPTKLPLEFKDRISPERRTERLK